MERSNRTGLPLSVLMIDVDHFKGYNDRHGHLAGDNALRGVSKILQHGRRANDVVARYGGEEFAIILLDVGKAAAKEVAERICAQVAEFPFEFGSTQPLGEADHLARGRVVPRRRRRARPGARRPPIGRCSRPRTPAATGFASPGSRPRWRSCASACWAAVPGVASSPLVASRRGHDVGAVGDRRRGRRGALARARSSPRSVPGFRLPDAVAVSSDLAATVRDRDLLLLAVPSAFVRETMERARTALSGTPIVVCASKGLEPESGATMPEVVSAIAPTARTAVLSGPSFAQEIAAGLPAALVAAAPDPPSPARSRLASAASGCGSTRATT